MQNNQKIPEGWSFKKLGELCLNSPDYGLNESAVPFNRDLPLYLRITDISEDGKYINEDRVSVQYHKLEKLLSKNNFLFARTGATVGKTYLHGTTNEKIAFAGYLIRFILDENKINPYFLFLYCHTQKYWNWVKVYSMRSGQPGINSEEYSLLPIILPPLPEQEKIAGILSCWDDGIEKLSALIEKKKIQKKALMQQLLTGKHRLKGFSSPWHEVKLGELLINISERNKELKILQVLSITNSKGFILPEEQFSRNVASEDLSNYKIVRQGDFAYNPSRINVGSIDQLNNFENGLLSPMYVVFRCNGKLLDLYMKHFIKSSEFIEKINCSAQGSVRETVDFKTLTSIKIKIPSDIAEQKAMAKILSKADEEIVLLNKKLEAFKLEKKALMQQLLTGKIRVKVN